MKKITNGLMVMGVLFLLNVQRPPLADKAVITTAKEVTTEKGKGYKVDVAASSLSWTGTKPSGKHSGTIAIREGAVQAKKSTIKGGSFVLDMTTITDTDMTGKGKEGLEGHLKSADFFDVAKFPTAEFVISSIAPIAAGQNVLLAGATHTISGNLTLKGITKNISFPAAVQMAGKMINANADFNIDRTEWGINYGADGKVAKEINLKLNLVANK